MVKKVNKFTPRYKKALIDSVVQALDSHSTKFTKNDIRLEVEAERFTVIGDTLILTSYRPQPRFRLENQPPEELLVCYDTTSDSMEIEGETELIG
jgi:hypothetical protein